MQVDYSNDFYPKIPFYMTYPMQSMYLTEMEYEKDMERMKQYYPAETKEIMELVEQRLDQLEYGGRGTFAHLRCLTSWNMREAASTMRNRTA